MGYNNQQQNQNIDEVVMAPWYVRMSPEEEVCQLCVEVAVYCCTDQMIGHLEPAVFFFCTASHCSSGANDFSACATGEQVVSVYAMFGPRESRLQLAIRSAGCQH